MASTAAGRADSALPFGQVVAVNELVTSPEESDPEPPVGDVDEYFREKVTTAAFASWRWGAGRAMAHESR
jgi:hypothetical protein